MLQAAQTRGVAKAVVSTTAARAASTFWSGVPASPPDPIFGLIERFKKDPFPKKVNLAVGAYRTEEGKPFVLEAVTEAEKRLLARKLDKEYAPISGVPSFCKHSQALAFGKEDPNIATVQTISGTGGLTIAFDFLREVYSFPDANAKAVAHTQPTWANHANIIRTARLTPVGVPYVSGHNLDFNVFVDGLKKLPEGSAVLLHACAHNPTGCDPTLEQWGTIADIFASKNMLPVFDMAYQGFATGDVARDGQAVRLFYERGLAPLVVQSYSKNMGLYGERVGALSVVCANAEEAANVTGKLKALIRATYSNPPIHGALVVAEILGDAELKKLWMRDLNVMVDRMALARKNLQKALKDIGSTLDWSHITGQLGMFCYSGLNQQQVETLINEHHIYLTKDGRISIAGVSQPDIPYLAECIHKVTSTPVSKL